MIFSPATSSITIEKRTFSFEGLLGICCLATVSKRIPAVVLMDIDPL